VDSPCDFEVLYCGMERSRCAGAQCPRPLSHVRSCAARWLETYCGMERSRCAGVWGTGPLSHVRAYAAMWLKPPLRWPVYIG
jgi:hypothetical protein